MLWLSPLALLMIFAVIAAMFAPLIPLRRRAVGIAGFPYLTLLLLVTNLVIFLSTLGGNDEPRADILQRFGMTPNPLIWYTLITHMFLHGDLQHICVNMLGLWLFGPHVEEAIGHWEYGLFYFACGIAAALTHLVIARLLLPAAVGIPMVGASGAIFGILGLFAVRFWRARVRVFLFFEVPAIWAVGAFALYQLGLGVYSLFDGGAGNNTANWAHIGGFLFGVAIALPLKMREQSKREYDLEDAAKSVALGDNDAAATYFRDALIVHPDDPDTHHKLAKVYIKLRHGEAAHRHFMDALRLHLNGGHSLAVARVYEDAIAGFETFPLPASLLQRIASSCEESGQYSLAVHALAELCREYPEAKEAEMSLLRLGKLQMYKMNQPQNAEGIFSEFIRLYPESDWRSHAEKLLRDAHSASSGFIPVPLPGGMPPPATPRLTGNVSPVIAPDLRP